MKRFHVNLAVSDLEKSTHFYSVLFGEAPTVRKPDYAKWMLEDPRLNFSLSASDRAGGINHIGLQADTVEELGEIQKRLNEAREETFDQEDAECCYAHSTKTWVRDPDQVAWETFVTFGDITTYGDDREPISSAGDDCCKDPAVTCCCS